MLSQAIHFADIVKSRRARGDAKAGDPSLAARSGVLARLASLAQIGELPHN